MATRQPSFSRPTRFTTGTRASSKNTSLNSELPTMVSIGRISMPGVSIGNITQVMPLCFGRLGIGADQQLAPVGHLGEARPDLLAGDDVLVAVAHALARQRRQVAARAGLAESLAPHLLAAQDAGQVLGLLLGAGLGHDRRPRVQRADEVHADVGRAGPRRLLEEDQLLDERGAAAAVLGRPVDARRSRRRTAGAASRCRTRAAPASRRARACRAASGSAPASQPRSSARKRSSDSEYRRSTRHPSRRASVEPEI